MYLLNLHIPNAIYLIISAIVLPVLLCLILREIILICHFVTFSNMAITNNIRFFEIVSGSLLRWNLGLFASVLINIVHHY